MTTTTASTLARPPPPPRHADDPLAGLSPLCGGAATTRGLTPFDPGAALEEHAVADGLLTTPPGGGVFAAPSRAPAHHHAARAPRAPRRPATGGAAAPALGGRLAVWCDTHRAFYRGGLAAYDGYHKRAKVAFDGGAAEWLPLGRDRLVWLAPRARSAGGADPDLAAAMAALGAAPAADGRAGGAGGAPPTPLKVTAPPPSRAPPAAGVSAPSYKPGDRLALWFDAAGAFCGGTVIDVDDGSGNAAARARLPSAASSTAGRRSSRRIRVLYDDGEDEWVAPSDEHLAPSPPPPVAGLGATRGAAGPHAACAPRVPSRPSGAAAVGWRVAVYGRLPRGGGGVPPAAPPPAVAPPPPPTDRGFRHGAVVVYDAASATHRVAYDDGRSDDVDLAAAAIKWVLPPGARAGAPPQPARRSRSGARRRRDGEPGGRSGRKRGASSGPTEERRAAKAARKAARRAAAAAAEGVGLPLRGPARVVASGDGALTLFPLSAPPPPLTSVALERELDVARLCRPGGAGIRALGGGSLGFPRAPRAGLPRYLTVRLLLATPPADLPPPGVVDDLDLPEDVPACVDAALEGDELQVVAPPPARTARPPTAASAARPDRVAGPRPPLSPLPPAAACGGAPTAWAATRSPPCGPPASVGAARHDAVQVVL